jgi:hypothetical protein
VAPQSALNVVSGTGARLVNARGKWSMARNIEIKADVTDFAALTYIDLLAELR